MDEVSDGERFELDKLKAQQDYDFRRQELELKRRELDLKEAEQRAASWRNPLVVGIFVAALGLFGNIVVASLQNWANASLAHQKAQSDLILEAIKTGDTAKANRNLQFFIEAHLIDDPHDQIKNAIETGRGPTLPAPVAEQMGEEYWMGRGGRTLDYKEAMNSFLSAADQGNARAMANIGWMYELGLGVGKDYVQAMTWYQKAVNHGDVIANWNIARLYENGWGVTRDLDMARSWYQKAADKGDTRSVEALKHVGQNAPY
jgi:TPR repeat protein